MSRPVIIATATAIAIAALIVFAIVVASDTGLTLDECLNVRWELYNRGVYTYDQTIALIAAKC